jgi:predicted RNA binding protein YcfA (HicA-like mRNA interferase family)
MAGYYVKTRGDHRQYKDPTKRGKVTVAGKLSNIWKQAGLE